MQSIADGHSDAYLTQFAKAVRALNVPIAISFGHEMNGNWYPWGTTQTTRGPFVAAWRHIHDLFSQAGASNVIWVWNPNIINPVPQVPLRPYWPGPAYVGLGGLTGYFATTGPQTYDTLYAPTMTEIRQLHRQAVHHRRDRHRDRPGRDGRARGSWSRTVTQHPDVLGFIWFDYNKRGVDWRVESRPIVRAAMAGDIAGLTLVNPRK